MAETTSTVCGIIRRETSMAMQFTITSIDGIPLKDEVTEWFPFSQMHQIFRNAVNEEEDKIVVNTWLLTKKGIHV
jgi:hypothetical protein